jgi:hypothetical protein
LRARGFGAAAEEFAAQIHRTKTARFRDKILAGDVQAGPDCPDWY